MKSAATQLARSIDDVLDMAQIDADEMALDLEDVRVTDLLEGAAARWATQAEAANVKIVVENPADLGLIRGDARRLGQILEHLVENALGQTPAGGVVTHVARGDSRQHQNAIHRHQNPAQNHENFHSPYLATAGWLPGATTRAAPWS